MVIDTQYHLEHKKSQHPGRSNPITNAAVRAGISRAFHNKDFKAGFGISAFGDSFIPTKTNLEKLVAHILAGLAWTPGYFDGISRTNDTWLQSEFIVLDLDNNVSVADCLADSFIRRYAILIHPSASSSAECYKTRVIFRLSEAVNGGFRRWRTLADGIMRHVGLDVDPASIKAAQPYFGSTNRIEEPYINLDAILPIEVAGALTVDRATDDMLAEFARRDANYAPRATVAGQYANYARATLANMASELARMSNVKDDPQNDTCNEMAWKLAHFVRRGDLTESEVRNALESAMHSNGYISAYKQSAFDKTFNSGFQRGYGDTSYEPEIYLRPPDTKRTLKPLPVAAPVATPRPFADVSGAGRYVSELPIPDGDVLLISDTGTGKTTWAKGQGIDTNPTHRVALSTALAETLDMENYQGLTPVQLTQVNRLTICLNSISKAAERTIHTLFADEIRQVLAHLRGDTFTGPESETTFNTLTAWIQRAERVLAADAYADETTVRFLKKYRPHLKVVVNTQPRARGALTLWRHKSGAIGKLWQLADENTGCVVVPTGSAALAKDLEAQAIDRYGAENVMALYQEVSSDPDRRAFLKHINAQIGRYRVFIYSPTVGSGIDVQTPVRATVGFFMAEPLAAPDCHQMVNRFRQTGETHVYVQRKEGNRETNPDVIYENAVQNAVATGHVAHFDAHGLSVMTDKQCEMLRLFSELEASDNASKNRLFEHFTELAKGYSSIVTCDVKDEGALTLTREQRDARQKEEKSQTLVAAALSPDEFRAMIESGQNTPDHAYGLQRWLIEKASGQDITTVTYDLLHTSEGRAALYLLTDHIHARIDALAQADRDESTSPVGKRHHYSRRKILLDDLVKRVFGRDGLNAGIELTAQHIQEAVGDFLTVSGGEFRLLFKRRSDLSADPRAVLSWVLRRLGMKLERSRRERDENGKRQYVYRVASETLTTMLELADSCYARQCRDAEARLTSVSQNVYQRDTKIQDLGQQPPGRAGEMVDYLFPPEQWFAELDFEMVREA